MTQAKRKYRHSLQLLSKLILAALVSLGSSALFADGHHQAAPAYTAKVLRTDGDSTLYWLAGGKGGNIVLSTGPDGLLLIDNDYRELSEALATALKPFGGIKAVDFVINTHWHGDHSEGNHLLGEHSTIVAHQNVRQRLSQAGAVPFFNMQSEAYPKHALPDITYKQDTTLHHNEQTIDLIHFPNSHTDGDSVVFFSEANVVHMGDLFFNGFFPFVDVDSGGNVVGMSASIDKILSMIDDRTLVVPGHGPMSNKAELSAFNAMLKGTIAEVKAMREQGLSLQAMQAQGLSDQWQSWTDGFIPVPAWISFIYNSL